MRSTYVTACIIIVLVVLWLASGQLGDDPPSPAKNIAEQNRRVDLLREEGPLTTVRIATIHASTQERILTVRGRTQSKRSVIVQSQIDGLAISRPVERGDIVKTGQLLCQISNEDRDAALHEATAAVNQARLEFEGSQRLSRQGLQSETAIAQAKAKLASTETALWRSQLNKQRLNIVAPFDGVIEDVHLEQGQYVVPGSQCVTLVDLDPMLLVGSISESELAYFHAGLQATAVLPDGRAVSGVVTFVARTSSDATRTYPIEVHVVNEDFKIPSGVTAQIKVPVESIQAQKISPALLTLDDRGVVGVHTIDAENIVHFNPIEIINDDIDGIWVSGLPAVTRVITVGQQLVVAGEEVNPTHEALKLVSVKDAEKGKSL